MENTLHMLPCSTSGKQDVYDLLICQGLALPSLLTSSAPACSPYSLAAIATVSSLTLGRSCCCLIMAHCLHLLRRVRCLGPWSLLSGLLSEADHVPAVFLWKYTLFTLHLPFLKRAFLSHIWEAVTFPNTY